jgi:ribosomal-protein-serine acetyltransferase
MRPPTIQEQMVQFAELRGAHVLLRSLRLEDAEQHFAAVEESRATSRRWLPWMDTYTSVEQSRAYVARGEAQRLLGEQLSLGIFDTTSGRLLGGVSLFLRSILPQQLGDEEGGAYEVGYWLRTSARGQGHMTEAVRLLEDYAFETLGARRVVIRCDTLNPHSAGVARRLGYTHEATLRHDDRDGDGNLGNTLVFARTDLDRRPVGQSPAADEAARANTSWFTLGDPAQHKTLRPIFDELRGERVLVRPYQPEDAEALFAAVVASRDYLLPWLPWAIGYDSVDDAREFINRARARWLLREDFTVSVWERESGRLLGGSGLHVRDAGVEAYEIGYWLRRDAAGHGYMAETVRLLADCAFDTLGAERVFIRCDARNRRSAAVAERVGFRFEGRLRHDAIAYDGAVRDTLIYALTRDDARGTE